MKHKLTAFFVMVLPCAAAPLTLELDLDGDGAAEQVQVAAEGIAVTGGAMAGKFPLPEGVPAPPEGAKDGGIRFADLNGDGLADLLFADESTQAIYLWTKKARADLGWLPGWSQKVKGGPREKGAKDLPSLAGTTVEVKDGMVHIAKPGGAAVKLVARELIALPMPDPLTPEAGLKSLKLPEGFRAELVAHEPQITDPVAFDWGADGRLWVVQMNDYPTGLDGQGKPGGVVKILTDADGDGQYEKTSVFAEGLAFPTGVMPWKKGALIASAPDIIYAEDTDGDGRADRQEVLFTGFKPGNQQHRFNGFEWGLDGWIYAANGDSGGEVKSIKTGRSVNISGRDVRFRPDSGEMETVSGMTQYGLRRDDWGNWFGNDNPVWLWHVTLPERYLARNPQLAVKRVKKQLANYPDPNRVYPASQPVERPNQPWSLNHVTSACTPAPYRDDLFGGMFADSVFIGEPVHNTVHREVLGREGSGFRSARGAGETEKEFLASTDNWFRPVQVRTGPDGALWVADFYRFVLEHPEWISPEMQSRLDLRAGSDKGRLYRISPAGSVRRRVPDFSKLDAPALACAMDTGNGWQRDMAQRLLMEKQDPAAVAPLRALLAPFHAPQVRLQALATLGGLGALGEDVIHAALADPCPWMRCEALRQSEVKAPNSLFPAVAALARDLDAAVRLQAAFTLGFWPAAKCEPVLEQLAAGADDDLHVAVMSSLKPDSALFRRLKETEALPAVAALPVLKPSSPDREKVIAAYAGVEKLEGDRDKGRVLFETICAVCHRLHGHGHEVGPDLDMTGAKPTDWLLSNILDPAQAIEARYRGWSVTLQSGTTLGGVVSAETANNLVLRLPGGVEQAILRSEIKSMEPVPGSLMPAGFESAFPPQQMADLLAWLRAGK